MLNVWIPLSSIVTIKFTVSLQTHVLCIKAFSISSLSPKSLCSINLYLTIHVLLFLNLKQLFYSQSLKFSYNFKIYLKSNLIPYFFEAFEYIFSIGSFEGHFSKFRFYGCFMQTSVLWSAPHILVGHYFECAYLIRKCSQDLFSKFRFYGCFINAKECSSHFWRATTLNVLPHWKVLLRLFGISNTLDLSWLNFLELSLLTSLIEFEWWRHFNCIFEIEWTFEILRI